MTDKLMPNPAPVFYGNFLRAVDGDTLSVEIDKFHDDFSRKRLRLLEVNCPEVRGVTRDAGFAALHFATEFFSHDMDWGLVVQTALADKYGRRLAYVWRRSDGALLNEALVTSGHGTWISVTQHILELRDGA